MIDRLAYRNKTASGITRPMMYKTSGITRPMINSFGRIMRRISDPLIKAPVEEAVSRGMRSVMLPLRANIENAVRQGLEPFSREMRSSALDIAAGFGVGGTLGGIISGATTLGGGALLEIFRDRNEQANNDLLVNKLMTELRAGQFVNTPQQMLPGNPTISELSNNVF